MQLVSVIVLPYFINWITYNPDFYRIQFVNVTINGVNFTYPIDPIDLLANASISLPPEPKETQGTPSISSPPFLSLIASV